MKCPKCETDVTKGSAFCSKCGAAMAEGGGIQPPTPKPDEPEKELWRGCMSGLALVHLWTLWIGWSIGLSILYFAVIGTKNPIFAYVLLGLIGLPLCYVLYRLAFGKFALKYRLTTHRFFKEEGIISRKMNELELIRVDDVSVSQNIIHRLFDVGIVTVMSTDATDPRTIVYGVKNPIDLKENIRTHVRKRRQRSLFMEQL